MLERNGYPPGVPCWVDTAQPDPDAAAEFYGGLFGWQFEDRMPADAPGSYLVAQLRGRDVGAIGSRPDGAPAEAMWNTYVWVESADDAAAAAKAAGGSVVSEPFDVLDAGRMAVLADPGGAVFCVWQAGGHRGAQLVNEPNTWNWSDLNTRDLEAAKEFYGKIFGWEAKALEPGENAPTMWCVPGYGEFLTKDDPDLPERLDEYEAPEGFADAVGWLQPMPEDQFPADVPPHWHVTFSVEDADASTERALELGGEVTVPPMDVPWVRLAVLRDPHGAAFTVGQFVPPG